MYLYFPHILITQVFTYWHKVKEPSSSKINVLGIPNLFVDVLAIPIKLGHPNLRAWYRDADHTSNLTLTQYRVQYRGHKVPTTRPVAPVAFI